MKKSKKDIMWEMSAKDLVNFLNWRLFQLPECDEPVGWLDQGPDGDHDVEKNMDELISLIHNDRVDLAARGLVDYQIKKYRTKYPDATEDDLCRFAFHIGAWTVMDFASVEVWNEYKKQCENRTQVTVQRVVDALIKTKGNKSQAAELLDCDVKTVRRKVKEFTPEQHQLVESGNAEAEQKKN